MDNRSSYLVKNILIFTISNFASKLLVFFLVPLYTSTLSNEQFGVAELVISFVALVMPVITVSIADSALRYSMEQGEDPKQVFTLGFEMITLGVVILCLLYPLFVRISFLKKYIFYVYIISIPNYYSEYFSMFSRGIGKVKMVGVSGVIATFSMVASNILLLLVFKKGIQGYLVSYSMTFFSSCIVLFFGCSLYSYFDFHCTLHKNRLLLKKMLAYSFPLIPNKESWWLTDTANKYILNRYCGTGDVGLYAVATKIPAIINTVEGFFSQAWVLSAIKENDADDNYRFYSDYYSYYLSLLFTVGALLIAGNNLLAKILFANDFYQARVLVPFLLISSILGGMTGFLGSLFSATKKTRAIMVSTLSGAGCSVLCNFILIPKIGLFGAVYSNVLAYFLIWLIRYVEIKKIMDIDLHVKKMGACFCVVFSQAICFQTNVPTLLLYLVQTICVLIMVLLWKKELSFFMHTLFSRRKMQA